MGIMKVALSYRFIYVFVGWEGVVKFILVSVLIK